MADPEGFDDAPYDGFETDALEAQKAKAFQISKATLPKRSGERMVSSLRCSFSFSDAYHACLRTTRPNTRP